MRPLHRQPRLEIPIRVQMLELHAFLRLRRPLRERALMPFPLGVPPLLHARPLELRLHLFSLNFNLLVEGLLDHRHQTRVRFSHILLQLAHLLFQLLHRWLHISHDRLSKLRREQPSRHRIGSLRAVVLPIPQRPPVWRLLLHQHFFHLFRFRNVHGALS